jgi:DNA-binding Lrp family transcriptional regulator
MNLKKEDKLVLSYLRTNSRIPLTRLSKHTGIPISTLHDRLSMKFPKCIQRYTTLLQFNTLGYNARAILILKVGRQDRVQIRNYFEKQRFVNSIYRINNGLDFLVEVVFKNMAQLEHFLEILDDLFALEYKEVFYIIKDIKRESFLSDPNMVKLENPLKTIVDLSEKA